MVGHHKAGQGATDPGGQFGVGNRLAVPVDKGGGALPPLVARHRHHQRLGDGGMIHQSLLYGFGLDVFATRDEEVVEPSLYQQLPCRSEPPLVASMKPAFAIEGQFQLAISVVTGKQGGAAHADLLLPDTHFPSR